MSIVPLLGHEVIVANVRALRAISHSDRKSDKVDAEKIARYARLDPEILRPIAHRTVAQQETLTLIRARDVLVRLRTGAVNSVRSEALRLSAAGFLHHLLCEAMSGRMIGGAIKELADAAYPETKALNQRVRCGTSHRADLCSDSR
jgi:transposase